jgi:hypothetical protein
MSPPERAGAIAARIFDRLRQLRSEGTAMPDPSETPADTLAEHPLRVGRWIPGRGLVTADGDHQDRVSCPRCGTSAVLGRFAVCALCAAEQGLDPQCPACLAEDGGETLDLPHIATCGPGVVAARRTEALDGLRVRTQRQAAKRAEARGELPLDGAS